MMEIPVQKRADEWLTLRRFAGLLALFVVAAYPEVVFGLTTFIHRDFGLFGHPLAHYHRECFWRGELPLWNPYNNLGLPFLAQWNTMTLYPGSIIYLLFPLPWSLNIFCLAHLWCAGMGMFWLAQQWTGNRTAAAVAGMAFAFNGLTLNALMWPNNIAGLGWMPWVVGLAELAWRKGGRSIAVGAIVATMQMLTGAPEVILFTWMIVGFLWAAHWFRAGPLRTKSLVRFVGLAGLVGALSAAQLFPFLDLLRHSHRDAGFATGAWAMPIWGWLNFLVPQFHMVKSGSGLLYQPEQFWTSSYYAGAVVLALAVWAAVRWRHPKACVLAALLLGSLVLALGDGGKVYLWLREILPVANIMRYPIKFVVVAVFTLPLLAALAVAEWTEAAREASAGTLRRVRWVAVVLLVVAASTIGLAKLNPVGGDDFGRTVWSAARSTTLALVLLVLLVFRAGAGTRLGGSAGLILLMGLIWLDVRTSVPDQNPTAPASLLKPSGVVDASSALGEGRILLSLAAMDFFYRTNSPAAAENYLLRRRGLHQNVNLVEGLPKVDGFFSLYLPEERRVHFRLYRSEHEIREGLADFLGVTRITSSSNLLEWSSRKNALPWVTGGQKPMFVDDATALTNLIAVDFDPRQIVFLPEAARLQAAGTNEGSVKVLSTEWSAQRVRVQATSEGPGWLVLAHSFYHPWRVTVDGARAPLWRANLAFQAVHLPSGRHVVELAYRDDAFRLGCAVSLAGLALAGVWWRRR